MTSRQAESPEAAEGFRLGFGQASLGWGLSTRFGEYRLETASRQLFKGDVEIHLSPKAFELLKLLVERRPRALSKAELHRHLWPDTFVSEGNLPLLVGEIRAALGDPARGSQYVRTVQRFGYAFSGSVLEGAGQPTTGRMAGEANCWLVLGSQRIQLPQGEHTLGRDPAASVWLNVSGVSRLHARIRVNGPDATIEDGQSKNGTFVRGERITAPTALRDGDEIRLGSLVLTFRVWSPEDTTETQTI
jgi:DNA-binding winged helix-turn-helix (wHTH) protein